MSANKKEIKLGHSKYLVIDLAEPLKENLEVYPGDPKPLKGVFRDINKTGYQHHTYRLGDHNFHPHGDAPKHQNIDLQNQGFEVFDLEYCFNSACLIDLSDSHEAEEFDNIKYLVEVKKEHLKPHSKIFSKKKAILIRTGYDRWLEANKKHLPGKIPYLNKEAADFLSEFKNIKVIGIDSLTIDPSGKHYAHQKFKELLIVESLVHLYDIPKNSRDDFDLQTSPIRIVGATGGPIIAYAFIKSG